MPDIPALILASGALGAAASGIVDVVKRQYGPLARAGFGKLWLTLEPFHVLLASAYGSGAKALLESQYVSEDPELLPRTLNSGIRAGLTEANAREIARILGTLDGETLAGAIAAAAKGNDLNDAQRNVVGRFELAVDARVQAALAQAKMKYIGSVQLAAMIAALVMAALAALGILYEDGPNGDPSIIIWAAVAGFAAVPLAPVYKDVASAVTAFSKTLRRK